MTFPPRAIALTLVLALAVPVAPSAWAARGTIRCESRNNSRNFCRVDTENNVSLRQQLSNTPCERNRTWGFDNSGIWVVGDGRVFLRDQVGRPINQGVFRNGMVYWNNGRRAWIAREGAGVLLGDVDSGRRYNFNRS